MSIVSLNASTTKVLDLLSAKPATAEPRADVGWAEKPGQDREGGFDQALRESSSERSARISEPAARDDAGRGDNEPASDKAQAKQDTDKPSGKSSAEAGRDDAKASSKDAETDSTSKADAETQGQADLQQQAEAGAAQAQSEAASAIQLALDATNTSTKAAQGTSELEASSGSSAQKQAQAAAALAARESIASAQGKAQDSVLQNTAAFSTATTQQQGTQSETGTGENRGESSATAQVNLNGQTAGNATAASAAFTMPDQPTTEARLPVNTANAAQQAEAAKALQAQPLGGQNDNDAVNTARLTRGLANAVQQRGGAVTLRLTPPEMGTVRIHMQISGANVSASFHAETASAQTLLTQQLSQLRTALETQGMNVEKLSVQPMASNAQSQNASQSQGDSQQQNQTAQQQSANDGRSRGQYSGSQSGSGQGSDSPTQQHDRPRGFFDQLNDSAQNAAA